MKAIVKKGNPTIKHRGLRLLDQMDLTNAIKTAGEQDIMDLVKRLVSEETRDNEPLVDHLLDRLNLI